MNMPSVCKTLVGNASYALWWLRTKSASKCSILLMALCTPMVSMVPSGFSAPNARIHTMSPVCVQISQNQQNGPLSAVSLNVNSKRVGLDLSKRVGVDLCKRVVKRVIGSILVVRQKKGKPRPDAPHRGKDGCRIGIRRQASAGKNKKEQSWSEDDINKAFTMWEANKDLPPGERKSKRQIALDCGIPYTTVCEQLAGRRGGGKRGKIAGGKRQA